VLEIDNALQARVQADPAAIAPVFSQFGTEFETRTRRKIAEAGFEYLTGRALTVTAKVRRTDRDGTIPYGGSFGHSSLVELPAPTDHTLTEADAGAEFVRDPVLLRAGYTGSFFHNDVTSVTFDNPFRAIDDRPVMHPYHARRYAKSIGQEVPLDQAVGRVAAEAVEVYPPGIPVILEGFRVCEDAVRYLREARDLGGAVVARDTSLATLRVL